MLQFETSIKKKRIKNAKKNYEKLKRIRIRNAAVETPLSSNFTNSANFTNPSFCHIFNGNKKKRIQECESHGLLLPEEHILNKNIIHKLQIAFFCNKIFCQM